MLDICNLLYILRTNNNRIKNVEVTGIITRELKRPDSLQENVKLSPNGKFVELDCCAIRFMGDDYVRICTGDGSADKVYLLNGKLVTFVNKEQAVKDIWTIRGTVALASKDKNSNLVAMFNFMKNNKGWLINPYKCKDVDISYWNKTGRPRFYTLESYNNGCIVKPKDILSTPYFVSEIKKDNNNQLEAFGKNPPVVGNLNITNVKNDSGSVQNSSGLVKNTSGESKTDNNNMSRLVFSRTKTKPKNDKLLKEFKVIRREAKERRKKQLEGIRKSIEEERDDLIVRILKNIRDNWKNKRSKYSRTGRSIFSEYVGQADHANSEYMGKTVKKYLIDIHDEVIDFALGETETVTAHKEALKTVRQMFSDKEKMLEGFLSIVTGVNLSGIAEDCSEQKVSLGAILEINPYILMLISPRLSFSDLETLAICLGFAGKPELRRQRNMMIVLEYIEKSSGNDTAYNVIDISRVQFGLTLTNYQYSLDKRHGHYFGMEKASTIETFLGVKPQTHYNEENFIARYNNCIAELSLQEKKQAFADLLSIGMCVKFSKDGVNYIESYSFFKKELYVYDKLYKMLSKNDTEEIEQKTIDDCVAEFEKDKGFKLEEKQVSAINLIRNRIFAIYGLPGGGKTTIIECCVKILKKEFGKDYKIDFAAPTGIASKRLSVTTGEKASTMHSKFKVGIRTLENIDEDKNSGVYADCFIFDEMGMVTINLLYEIFSKIRNPRIIFSGDIAQLAPIGKGIPFKDIVSIIPTETLMVSKRSTSGSNIALNNLIISDKSTGYEMEPLKDGNDFCICECNNDELPNKVCAIVQSYLNGTCPDFLDRSKYSNLASLQVKPSEIQVLTPVAQEKFSWGTKKMNLKLQNIFNPRKDVYFKVFNQDGLELRVGDRVLNKDNSHQFLHYKYNGKTGFTKTWDCGVVNGDIGEILGIIKANRCKFHEQIDPEPEGHPLEGMNIRDDEDYCNDDFAKFLVVKYDDYVILYLCRLDEEESNELMPVLKGSDLKMLDLAYALTVHKIQGGQNKLIIFMLGKMGYSEFITNNLILTGVTRARDGEFLIGDVGDSDASTLSQGRRRFQHSDVTSVNRLLYED